MSTVVTWAFVPPTIPGVIRAGPGQGAAVEATVDEIDLSVGATPPPSHDAPPALALPETGAPHATLASAQFLPTAPDLSLTGRFGPADAPAYFRVPLDTSDSEVSVGLAWSPPASGGREDLSILDGSGATLLGVTLTDRPALVSVRLHSVQNDSAAIFVAVLPHSGGAAAAATPAPDPHSVPGGGSDGFILTVTKSPSVLPYTAMTDDVSGSPSLPPLPPTPGGRISSPFGPSSPNQNPPSASVPAPTPTPTPPGVPVGGIFQPRTSPYPPVLGGIDGATGQRLAGSRSTGGNASARTVDPDSGSTSPVPGPVRPAVQAAAVGVAARNAGPVLFATPAGSWIDRVMPGAGKGVVSPPGVASLPAVTHAISPPPPPFAPGLPPGIDGPDRQPAELPDLGPLAAVGVSFPAQAAHAVGVLGVLSVPVGNPGTGAAPVLASDIPGRALNGDEELSGPRRRPRRGVIAFAVSSSAALILGVSAPGLTSVLRTYQARTRRNGRFVSGA